MSTFEIERALFHWPTVVRLAPQGWAQNFAKSIAAQSRRRNWNPTAKQAEIMRRMVNDLFTQASNEEGDFTVIE
ncbi:hypothetical protein [Salipiger aestuarii]|uniref:hypothetical protein n=1 Tax=Salipiger aestuarii TaxID=568098 RepID=UPI00123845BD|nr:hypothetical protein [Salipiger aestuarii]KAA8616264.1 hypothetical protein AL037_01550 [Salipiger aestuarii]